jgi:hypothetical protein
MPHPKDDPKSPEWRPYISHDENMPPSMYEYFSGAVWQRKKIP